MVESKLVVIEINLGKTTDSKRAGDNLYLTRRGKDDYLIKNPPLLMTDNI